MMLCTLWVVDPPKDSAPLALYNQRGLSFYFKSTPRTKFQSILILALDDLKTVQFQASWRCADRILYEAIAVKVLIRVVMEWNNCQPKPFETTYAGMNERVSSQSPDDCRRPIELSVFVSRGPELACCVFYEVVE